MFFQQDYDLLWVAIDEAGHVGAFFSAGQGPIPRVLFDFFSLENIYSDVFALPEITRIAAFDGMFLSDDVIRLGSRGAYVFDWSDVHRTTNLLDAYERLAAPEKPLHIGHLPDELRNAAAAVKFPNILFASSQTLKPQDVFDCSRSDVAASG